eukprot:Clim_evm18s251 gene=Clim_evmTU18s251
MTDSCTFKPKSNGAAATNENGKRINDEVAEYYGKILKTNDDLKTDACATATAIPKHIKKIMGEIHDEVASKYYGCGLCVPDELEGRRVLDLGSGSGRDVYIISRLVGEDGYVLGVDMTDAQLDVANKYVQYHTDAFGYKKPNVEFRKGYIEKLDELNLPDNSFDVIVSNCVINLSPDKEAVLREAYRLLKPGGELYFSDVYSDRRVSEDLRNDKVLWGECLSGALYWNDFHNLAKKVGFADPRLVEDHRLGIGNKKIKELVGHIDFYSATYRLFKLPLEPACEDYGQAVIYKGTIPSSPKKFTLDNHHIIDTGKVFPVCGNTYDMLAKSRFAKHFEFIGDTSTHYGIFKDCGTGVPYESAKQPANQSGGFGPPAGGCC